MSRAQLRAEGGSLPLALLAAIVVAGLVGALFVRMVGSEAQVRFDRDFAEALQVADVGINRALFALNEGRPLCTGSPAGSDCLPTDTAKGNATVDGTTYEWWVENVAPRQWDVTSLATSAGGVPRKLVARIEERSLFFPGAFADRLIALQGTSTEVDSYNSAVACVGPATDECGWGTSSDFGTGNGSIGTNEVLKFKGVNVKVRPGGAFLYDWLNNPPTPSTQTIADPFGDRCEVSGGAASDLCSETTVRTVDARLELSSVGQTAFIRNKFEGGTPCDQVAERNTLRYDAAGGLLAYQTPSPAPSTPPDPTDSGFDNYYCVESLDFDEDVELADSVTANNPVVIFVRNRLHLESSNINVACFDPSSGAKCDAKTEGDANERVVRPVAGRLQIYVLGEGDHVTLQSNTMFAGVIYAPMSLCGAAGGGANTDIYGAVICADMSQIGNWRFHYDDALGNSGAGVFNVAFWYEEPPTP